MNRSLMFSVLAILLQFALPLRDADAETQTVKTIVFVCAHGSVKSQMAAAHFNRIARERGLPYTAVSRGIEVDASIPASIKASLSQEGLAPTDSVPTTLTSAEASGAADVVAFDNVPDDKKGSANVSYWSDVPPATKDYTAARDAIVRHIDDLVSTLQQRVKP